MYMSTALSLVEAIAKNPTVLSQQTMAKRSSYDRLAVKWCSRGRDALTIVWEAGNPRAFGQSKHNATCTCSLKPLTRTVPMQGVAE
jgi:hypothetical protein